MYENGLLIELVVSIHKKAKLEKRTYIIGIMECYLIQSEVEFIEEAMMNSLLQTAFGRKHPSLYQKSFHCSPGKWTVCNGACIVRIKIVLILLQASDRIMISSPKVILNTVSCVSSMQTIKRTQNKYHHTVISDLPVTCIR